jgi:hypothetical protein
MENRPATLKGRRLRVPLFTVLACLLVAIAFTHVNYMGIYVGRAFYGTTTNLITDPEDGSQSPARADDWSWGYRYCQGWPVPFAEHELSRKYDDSNFDDTGKNVPLVCRVIPFMWTSLHISSITGLICDVLLSLLLVVATDVVVLRLERRTWKRLQFSIADMFSLIATVSMVLGLIYFDDRLSIGKDSTVADMYVRLCDLPLFDRVMVLFAIACAVWLIVSTAMERLGGKHARQ